MLELQIYIIEMYESDNQRESHDELIHVHYIYIFNIVNQAVVSS